MKFRYWIAGAAVSAAAGYYWNIRNRNFSPAETLPPRSENEQLELAGVPAAPRPQPKRTARTAPQSKKASAVGRKHTRAKKA